MHQIEFFKMGTRMNQNTATVWYEPDVNRLDREILNNHKGSILWFTGLSASGKSTIANALDRWFLSQGIRTYVLDGDNVRQGLCNDLGFSDDDRKENIRRIGEVSKLMLDAGLVVLTAFISPFRKDRQTVRELVEPGDFVEIFCDTPLHVCEQRDPKGLYRRARAGELAQFTGISSPYERPIDPEIVLESGETSVEDCIIQIQNYLVSKKRLYMNGR